LVLDARERLHVTGVDVDRIAAGDRVHDADERDVAVLGGRSRTLLRTRARIAVLTRSGTARACDDGRRRQRNRYQRLRASHAAPPPFHAEEIEQATCHEARRAPAANGGDWASSPTRESGRVIEVSLLLYVFHTRRRRRVTP